MAGRGIHLFPFNQQRVRHPAPVEQLKPLHRIARQATDLKTEDRPHTTARDRIGKPRKAVAFARKRTRPALVRIHGLNQVVVPAQGARLVGQRVLTLRGFPVRDDLRRRRLPDVNQGTAFKVAGRDLLACAHRPSPLQQPSSSVATVASQTPPGSPAETSATAPDVPPRPEAPEAAVPDRGPVIPTRSSSVLIRSSRAKNASSVPRVQATGRAHPPSVVQSDGIRKR